MKYEEALKRWGQAQLTRAYDHSAYDKRYKAPDFDLNSITVDMVFNEGYACCGNNPEPDCYCSRAESPSANMVIEGIDKVSGHVRSYKISADEFDFTRVLGELIDVADGKLVK